MDTFQTHGGVVGYLCLPVAQRVKNPTCNAGNMGLILGSGRCPGGGHGAHPSILAGESPWTEEPGGLQSVGLQKTRTRLSVPHTHVW